MTAVSQDEARELSARFASAPRQDLLAWGLKCFDRRIALSSSFGAEDVVLIDMLAGIDPKARVFTLDTLRLHTETYSVIDAVRARYGVELEILYPDLGAVDAMVKAHGYNCFYQGVDFRKMCCGIRKVEPLERALGGLDAWITGMRQDQGSTRADVALVEIDDVHGGLIKLNPLADWTSDMVWAYISAHDVPYNELHDRGFPSIGCAPCTRAVQPGDDPRAGRWWWELDPTQKECGIHVGYDPSGNPTVTRAKDQ